MTITENNNVPLNTFSDGNTITIVEQTMNSNNINIIFNRLLFINLIFFIINILLVNSLIQILLNH